MKENWRDGAALYMFLFGIIGWGLHFYLINRVDEEGYVLLNYNSIGEMVTEWWVILALIIGFMLFGIIYLKNRD